MNTTRDATRLANPISCVTRSMVMPSTAIASSTLSTSPVSSGSSAEVISSNSINCGRMASPRAIARFGLGHLLHDARGERDVPLDREMGEQVIALEDDADPLAQRAQIG